MEQFGVVLNFHRKGFGFLEPKGSRQQVFFHINDVIGHLTLREGDFVSFEFQEHPKGARAINVRLLSPETAVQS
jgi:cold shock CspA family protein